MSRTESPSRRGVPSETVVGRSRARLGIVGSVGITAMVGLVAVAAAWPNLAGVSATRPPVTQSGQLPTGGPSEAPDQSVSPSSPIESGGSILEPTVVDRPGVPAAMYDRYWFQLNQAGRVGTTARVVLPADEGLVGMDTGLVASVIRDESFEPVIGPNGATIKIRDLVTGETIRSVDTGLYMTYGLVTGSLLWWTGRTLPIGPDSDDGGVWVIDVLDPASVPTAAVQPSDLTAAFGDRAARSLLWVTDRGRSVLSTVVGDSAKATQIFDVATGTLKETLTGITAHQVVDGIALRRVDERLGLYDIQTGQPIGEGVESRTSYWSVVGNSEVFAPIAQGGVYKIVAIDLTSGASRVIYVQDDQGLVLDQYISAPDLLALVPDRDPVVNSAEKVEIPVAVLDPGTGTVQNDAFIIGAP